MTTKEKIIDQSLTLFAAKGFKGTSVKNIADAVGIKDASLYKHFKSKREILDTIVEITRQHITEMSMNFGLPDDRDMQGSAEAYAQYDEDALVKLSKEIFLFYLKDSYMSRFWKMGTIEMYQNPEVRDVFGKLFFEDSITYQSALFAEMSRANVLVSADPQAMAMSFYAPIYFLLSKYANTSGKEEEALEILERQVREFCRVYKKSSAEM